MKQNIHLSNYIFNYIDLIVFYLAAIFCWFWQTSFARIVSFMEYTSLKIEKSFNTISDLPQNSTFLQATSILNDFCGTLKPKKVFITLNTCGL